MRTTFGTRTTTGTSNDEEGFKGPEDIGDVLGFGGELGGNSGSPSRRSPMGGTDLRKGLDLEKPRAPRSGIGYEIGKSPAGNLGLGLEIPLPVAAPVSARGGVSIDPATGEIRGGYGGLGIGKGPIGASIDVGVDTPKGSEDFGCFKYVTFNVGPFSHTVSKNECEPKRPKSPSTSTPTSAPPNDGSFKPGEVPPFDPRCKYSISILCLGNGTEFIDCIGYGSNESTQGYMFKTQQPAPGRYGNFGKRTKHGWAGVYNGYDYYVYEIDLNPSPVGYVEIRQLGNSRPVAKGDLIKGAGPWYKDDAPEIGSSVTTYGVAYYSDYWTASHNLNSVQAAEFSANFMNIWPMIGYADYAIKIDKKCPGDNDYMVTTPNTLSSPSPFSSSSPLPNPPPTKKDKKMDDKCCKILIQLQLETLRQLGRKVGPKGVMVQSTEKGFIGEEIERIKTPITNPKKPEKIKVRFTTVYQMLMYALKQDIALDTALDPQSFKIPVGQVQNPAYNRDSEHSLKSNNQPDKDKAGNDRELEINKDDDVIMGGFLLQQSYMFKMLQRLEYLFPPGELKDAFIAKSLLIPGAKGDIKIHNMIMAYEVQMQYLDAALGNPREILTIKDANPAIEGDQPIEIQSLSISDLLRQNIKFHIDTGGDVDALVNLVLRDFRTNLANRLDQIKTAEMVQALFEDSGMLEKQEYVDVHLEGDPYAGQWVKGQGFKANPDLEKKTEESTEKVLRETMKPTEQRVKVSRRHKDEKTDMRDLLRGLADFVQRLLSIPSAGDAGKSIDQLVESAKFKIQTDMALIRQNVTQAAAASRNRTRKRKK